MQSFYGLVDAGSSITYTSRSSVLTAQTPHRRVPGRHPTARIALQVGSDNTPADRAGLVSGPGAAERVAAGERVVERAVIRYDRIVFPTMLPPCERRLLGWRRRLADGGAVRQRQPAETASFDLNNDGRLMAATA